MQNYLNMITQKSFNYQFNTDQSDLDFFVNKTNFNAFKHLTYEKNKLNFLNGPEKAGKTFLSQIWLKKNNAIKFNNNFEYIIKNKNNILIDELLLFQEEIVFHIVDYCILNKLKILITSKKKINEINFKFNDLSSRLKTFTNLEINKPDDEMLSTILIKLLIDKQFIINSNEIFEYILRRVDRSYKGINTVVEKLDILSLEKKRQLTIPLIKEIL